ncbi:MAG: DUF4290 domain-containing protein [Bacteroidetes bacterium]|jgi:hypothetical protein|nr:DUF4290 domain-containing protein [Bacteroidota bacterium]
MNFDYNTTRKDLVLPEYGRNVQKMVDYLKTISDKEERNRLARGIINVMGNLNPHLRDIADFKHKLWDHLAIMSNFELDIDSPYEMPTPGKLHSKPRMVKYPQSKIRYKHYGKAIEMMINKAIEMEEGEEKQALIVLIANHMKKQYLTWNKDAVQDYVIFGDLKELSNGQIVITEDDLKLAESKDILSKNRSKKRNNNQRKNK